MGHQKRLFAALLILVLLVGTPGWVLAKGGGGGGHGGGHCSGGGGHSSGGHSSGSGTGHAGAVVNSSSQWGGWTTFGSHGYASGNAGSPGFGWGPSPAYNYGMGLGVNTQSTVLGPSATGPGIAAPPAPNANSFPPAPLTSPQSAIEMPQTARELIEQGEGAFKAGNYQEAVSVWRQVVVDHPQNGLLMMMLGQALFATGEYEESVYAIQSGMQQLPMAQWGVVVSHSQKLYGNNQDYTAQLRALERAQQAKPSDPALHFLTGFQYGYLGFLDQAIDQLDETLVLVPHDEVTDLLRNEMQIKRAKSSATHAAQSSPAAHGQRPTLH